MAVFDDLPAELQFKIAKHAVLESRPSIVFDIRHDLLLNSSSPSSERFATALALSRVNKTLRAFMPELVGWSLSLTYDMFKRQEKLLPLYYTAYLAARKRHRELGLPDFPSCRNAIFRPPKVERAINRMEAKHNGEAKEVYITLKKRERRTQMERVVWWSARHEIIMLLRSLLITLETEVGDLACRASLAADHMQ